VGKTWAGLDNISTLGDFLDVQDTPEGAHLYMFDGPMMDYCPSAMERMRHPKYQARNYAYIQTSPTNTLEEFMRNQCQALMIIGKKGTGTPLHADSEMEGTWTQALSGRKLWRLFPPTEYWRLYPNRENYNGEVNDDGEGYYPQLFYADAMNPDFDMFPLLDGALMYEALLEPGEGMVVPAGWAHQVYNVDDAVSAGENILDWHDVQGKMLHTKFLQHPVDFNYDMENRFYQAFFFPLDHNIPRAHPEEHLTYTDWCAHHFLPSSPEWFEDANDTTGEPTKVPQTVMKFVQSRTVNELDAYRDMGGAPAVVVATRFHFTSVVKYLVETGDANINEPTINGETALDVALGMEYTDLADLLVTRYGAVRGKF
jgi:hypothetical protein